MQFYANGASLGSPVALAAGKAIAAGLLFPAAGGYLITATYSGDAAYAATTSAGIPLTVTGANSSTKLAAASTSIPAGATNSFAITVSAATGGAGVPTGTVRVFASTTVSSAYLGTLPLMNGTATVSSSFAASGNYSMVALYSGDAVFSPSTSPVVSMTVTSSPAYQIAVASPSISISAGATTNNTDTVILTAVNGFAGPVSLACSVTALGAQTSDRTPTCTFDKTPVTLAAGGTSSASLMISTVQSRNVSGAATQMATAKWVNTTLLTPLGEGTSLCAVLLWLVPRRRLPWRSLRLVLVLTAACVTLTGCGGGARTASTTNAVAGTTAGSYMVTITSSTTVAGVATPPAPTVVLMVNSDNVKQTAYLRTEMMLRRTSSASPRQDVQIPEAQQRYNRA